MEHNKSLKCCGLIHSTEMGDPVDLNGCIFPIGHAGPHEFISIEQKRYQWETDLECNCEHCKQCEGDYCTVYWEVRK